MFKSHLRYQLRPCSTTVSTRGFHPRNREFDSPQGHQRNNMRVLILDDMDVRHDKISRMHLDDKVDHAYTAEEATYFLNTYKYQLVYLDHDLAAEHYVDGKSEESTGFDVAMHIHGMSKSDLPDQVIIHSWNPVGAERMYDQLKDLGIFVSRKPA